MILRKEGFVRATRGQLGGYTLAKPADEIPVGAVLEALGGRLYDDSFCNRHAGQNHICTHAVDCSVRSLWQVIQGAVDHVVDRITISDLLAAETTPKSTSNVTMFAVPQRARK
jgi:Rrf2 family protein